MLTAEMSLSFSGSLPSMSGDEVANRSDHAYASISAFSDYARRVGFHDFFIDQKPV